MEEKRFILSPKGRRVFRPYQWSSCDGHGDIVVADKDKWHECPAHIYKIGEYLQRRGLDVQYEKGCSSASSNAGSSWKSTTSG